MEDRLKRTLGCNPLKLKVKCCHREFVRGRNLNSEVFLEIGTALSQFQSVARKLRRERENLKIYEI